MADDNIPQYPFMFSPDQFSNKFSLFQGKPMTWPTQYQGTPTDALGRPIQSYLDTQAQHDAWAAAHPAMAPATTLNSNPLSDFDQLRLNAAINQVRNASLSPPGDVDGGGRGAYQGNFTSAPINQNTVNQLLAKQYQGGAAAKTAQPAAPQNPYDMNAAYLTALSNPGKVVTPGATVPQSPTPSGQSGVLQQFLANWKPQQGAGNYSAQPFVNALRGQV